MGSGCCWKSLQVKTWLRFSYWNLYFSRTICPISFVFKIILPFIFGSRMTKTFWLIWMHGAFRRMCISSKIWRLILNMLIRRRRRRARMGKLVGVCYSHFSFSSPLSSYLLILSILRFQTVSWTIINHSHQFHLIYHMQIIIIHISFTFVSLSSVMSYHILCTAMYSRVQLCAASPCSIYIQ